MATAQGTTARPNIVFMLCDNVGWGDSLATAEAPRPLGSTSSPAKASASTTTPSSRSARRRAARSDRPAVGALWHVHSGSRPGKTRPDAVGVHHRRASLGRGIRDVDVGQVASRGHRRAAAKRPGLRRVVGLPQYRRRGRLCVLCSVQGDGQSEGDRVAQDLGGQRARSPRRSATWT